MRRYSTGMAAYRCAVSIRARHCWRAMPGAYPYLEPLSDVSIRARHCWRAMLSRGNRWCVKTCCFNPRPPLLAGDAASQVAGATWAQVSIRARHCWRAMQSSAEIADKRGNGFNPRPPLLAGDAPCARSIARAKACFNPRPPLLAGDAAKARVLALQVEVSIRARHCWRAMQALIRRLQGVTAVSIRARHCWRAMRSPAGSFRRW